MYIKEYRIPLPLTVDEYKIAQLYMIQKKSLLESNGSESRLEIVKNEPYENGPGGSGQYTYKIFHIGSHLPNWFRSILPKAALQVVEEAWNAYPYTKTIYRCPFVEKFKIEIETVYKPDGGVQENVFDLTPAELKARGVDLMNFVSDLPPSGDYHADEDPLLYVSEKTGRGPLTNSWLAEHSKVAEGALDHGTSNGSNGKGPGSKKAVMCAYKLCKVEFKYWGMQTRIEKFIDDIALRKTMLRAHRQAWAWQDEWFGLDIDAIRDLEASTQAALADPSLGAVSIPRSLSNAADVLPKVEESSTGGENTALVPGMDKGGAPRAGASSSESHRSLRLSLSESERRASFSSMRSPGDNSGLYDGQNLLSVSTASKASWASLEESDNDDEFFDAPELIEDYEDAEQCPEKSASDLLQYPTRESMEQIHSDGSMDDCSGMAGAGNATPPTFALTLPEMSSCSTAILILVVHGGSPLLGESDCSVKSKDTDVAALHTTFDSVARSEFPSLLGSYALKLVECPQFQSEALGLLTSIRPIPVADDGCSRVLSHAHFPINAVGLLSTASIDYQATINTVVTRINKVYQTFLMSPEGTGFCGQVCVIGDSMGSVVAYDLLTQCYRHSAGENMTGGDDSSTIGGSKSRSDQYLNVYSKEDGTDLHAPRPIHRTVTDVVLQSQCSLSRQAITNNHFINPSLPANGLRRGLISGRQAQGAGPSVVTEENREETTPRLTFDVHDLFMLGSPLGVILSQRIMAGGAEAVLKPRCSHAYNLFHSSDPSAARVEPLIDRSFSSIYPVMMDRYIRPGRSTDPMRPLQNHESINLADYLQKDAPSVSRSPSPRPATTNSRSGGLPRQESGVSLISEMSRESCTGAMTTVATRWWGSKRLDFCLYSPEAVASFPATAIPQVLHGSFWDSTDMAFFVMKQLMSVDGPLPESPLPEPAFMRQGQKGEKWTHLRTALKTKNLLANHRGNDVIVTEGDTQVLSARFVYGPLDISNLSDEKVDVYSMEEGGRWIFLAAVTTDKLGRAMCKVPAGKLFRIGVHPIKMVVRVDHSYADFYLIVLPVRSACVVFSIDGSFTASMSITGNDPKVRPGSVDIVRHWQSLGYLILYVSARPDLQRRSVVRWLAQHNFPHGPVTLMERISPRDSLKQKAIYLKGLIDSGKVNISTAYGSTKDIQVYRSIGLSPGQIYAVGKPARRSLQAARTVSDGYAVHLQELIKSPKLLRADSSDGTSSRLLFHNTTFMIKDCLRPKEAAAMAAASRKKSRQHHL